MTKRTSRRALAIDWRRVAACFEAVDNHETTKELAPGWQRGEFVEPCWAPEYLHALQAALEGRDFEDLLSLLDGRALLHPQLLPIVAEILRSFLQPVAGAGSRLTAVQDRNIRHFYDALGRPGELGVLQRQIATMFGVSVDTIKRSLARTKA